MVKKTIYGLLSGIVLTLGATSCKNHMETPYVEVPERITLAFKLSTVEPTKATPLGEAEFTDQKSNSLGSREKRFSNLYLFFCDENDNYITGVELKITGAPVVISDDESTPSSFVVAMAVDEYRRVMGRTCNILTAANLDLSKTGNYDPFTSVFEATTLSEAPLGKAGEFLIPWMSYEEFPVELPRLSDQEMYDLEESGKPMILNDYRKGGGGDMQATIKLERGVARLDFKDGSNFRDDKGERLPHTYSLEGSDYTLRLTSMVPVNVGTAAYVFKHTSYGTVTDSNFRGIDSGLFNKQYPTTEFPAKWWVDYDADFKDSFIEGKEPGADIFINPISEKDCQGIVAMNEIDKISATAGFGYKPWRYIMENTLPSVASMLPALTTGLRFEALLCDKTGAAIKPQYENGSIAPSITVEWQGDTADAIYYSGDSINPEGYYLTYNYFIRSEGESQHISSLYPMEFGVVRNNDYCISIAGFNSLPKEGNVHEANGCFREKSYIIFVED